MQHLTPVGLSKDGASLVLLSDTGEEFLVALDRRFRAALRGDNARLGQLEMKMESALRPRDIQARIRAGESAEEVAAAAQTTVEAIMPFAAPVIAERAHVAETAQKASIRRRSSESSPAARTLTEAALRYLSDLGVRSDDVSWDAWRREDGRWTVTAQFLSDGADRRAEFSYDQPGRFVLADNDEAMLLTGEAQRATAATEPTRRLSAVPTDGPDDLPLGDDALELVRDPAPPATPVQTDPEPRAGAGLHAAMADPEFALVSEPEPSGVNAAEPATAAPEPAPAAVDQGEFDLTADHGDADWISQEPPSSARHQAAEQEYPAAEHDDSPAPAAPAEADADGSAEDDAQPTAAEQKPRRKGRSSVPSWDEIMFGGAD